MQAMARTALCLVVPRPLPGSSFIFVSSSLL
jgi:hypothetical protein